MDAFLFVFNTVASTTGFIVVTFAIAFFLYGKDKKARALFFLAYSAVFMGAVSLLKLYFAAPRPEGTLVDTSSYGFPSGHAAGVMYLALCICIHSSELPRAKRYAIYIASALFAVVVGVSRVYLYAHTPTQVFGGFVVGAAWGLGWWILERRKG